MFAKKPVIACNSGGPTESIKHGSTGFLCNSTADDFADAMVQLLEDEHKRKQMGEAAHQRVCKKFSLTTFTDKLENILFNIIQ